MFRRQQITSLSVMLALATSAYAQDSVSKTLGLPGDALDPHLSSDQVNSYVVDLTPFSASWGTKFAVGPIIKSTKFDPDFFNNLFWSNSMSATLLEGRNYPSSSYSLWTGAGFGINNDSSANDAGSNVSPAGLSNQFAIACAESGFDDLSSVSYNGVITAVVNYDPNDRLRMFVRRIQTAVNGIDATENESQIGYGAVDSHGNTAFRCDDFGVAGTAPIVGNNYFVVDALARSNGLLNVINIGGGADAPATEHVVKFSASTYNSPTLIPESLAGRPVLLGTNFDGDYAFEQVAGSVTTNTDHLGASPDHRGNVSFSRAVVFPKGTVFGGGMNTEPGMVAKTIGTAAIYGKDLADETKWINLWGVRADGSVSGNMNIPLPATITDCDVTYPDVGSIGEFIFYLSQTAFRGGNGPIAIGNDGRGNILVACNVVGGSGFSDDGDNAIAVARFNPNEVGTPTVSWTLGAYTDGMPILDGKNGTAIGQLVELGAVTGGAPLGPSLSTPVIDELGNLYFVAAVELFDLGGGASDFDSALIRAVYQPAKFCYKLELVMELGQVFRGQNSDRDYQIQFMGIADDNSVSSATMFSGNALQCAFNNADVSGLKPQSAAGLGGLVVAAEIVYDADNNGTFDTSVAGDEEYNVLLLVVPNE